MAYRARAASLRPLLTSTRTLCYSHAVASAPHEAHRHLPPPTAPLLSLQWQEVSLTRNELTVRAEKAKDGETRTLPISASLKAVLEM